MALINPEFAYYARLRPPFPPTYLERFLTHLGDEIIIENNESSIRLFCLHAEVQLGIVDWLHSLWHLLPPKEVAELFQRVDEFGNLDLVPPMRLHLASQLLFDDLRMRLGDATASNRGTQQLLKAWAHSEAGQEYFNTPVTIPEGDPSFEEFFKRFSKLVSSRANVEGDIEIEFDDINENEAKIQDEDAMEVDDFLGSQASQPIQASQFFPNTSVVDQSDGESIEALPEAIVDQCKTARAALRAIESAANMSTQVSIDQSTFDFLHTAPAIYLNLIQSELKVPELSEATTLQFFENVFLLRASELSYARSTALLQAFILPYMKGLSQQASRNAVASMLKILKAHSEALVEAVLSVLASDLSSFGYQSHHSDLIFKLLSDACVTPQLLQAFLSLLLHASAAKRAIWKEPTYDLISRVFALPKTKFDATLVELFGTELQRQVAQDADWNATTLSGKRIVLKVIMAANEITKKGGDILATLSRNSSGVHGLVSVLSQCQSSAASAIVTKIEQMTVK